MSNPTEDETTRSGRRTRPERKSVLLRLDPTIHDAVVRWADDELRSVNAQIEIIIRKALAAEGRLPRAAAPLPKRGRPRKEEQ